MAFIVTSKNKARPPQTRGGSSRSKVYSDQIHSSVQKSESEISDQRTWMMKSNDERTRIAIDTMKRDYVKSETERGVEVSTNQVDSLFSKVAEHSEK